MLEHTELCEQFQQLLSQQQQALDIYADLSAQSTDTDLRRQLCRLYRDKQRHVELTERLLEIIS